MTSRHIALRWLVACMAWLWATGACAQTLEFRHAEFAPDAVAWQPIELPDHWRVTHPGLSGDGWYRIRFSWSTVDTGIHAVYLPRLCMNSAVYLNDVLLGDGGQFEEPVSRNWNRPLLLLIPPGVLRTGENTLLIRLRSVPYSQGSLSPVMIGAESELREDYEQQFFVRITLNQVITLLIAGIGVLMLSLWWRRRQDTMYAYFGTAALIWAINSTNLYLRDIPLASRYWELLVGASTPVFVALLMISLLRFINWPRPRFERLLWGMLLMAPLTLLVASPEAYFALSTFWFLLGLCATLFTSTLLAISARRDGSFDQALLAGAIWIGLLFGIHDWLMHASLLWYADAQSHDNNEIYLVHYAAPLVFLVVGWIMTARFVRVLNQYESLNKDLERRVADKHHELEANFVRLEALTKEQAMMAERQRIVADMHDGLGGQLVTALRLVESNRVDGPGMAELLRESLDDMRIVMNSITPGEHDLDAVLGSLRYRLTPRFERTGIELDWQLDATLPEHALTPQDSLNIQRILQESFTNILKHSGATRITVSNRQDEAGGRIVTVRDNGHGIRGEQRGHGIANMQRRAARIGGEVRIDSSEAGTTVTLRLPP